MRPNSSLTKRLAILATGVALTAVVHGSASAQTMNEYSPPSGGVTAGIAPGADGNVWSVGSPDKAFKITPAGVITEYPIPTAGSAANIAALATDGAVWFTELIGHRIGRIAPNGVITEFTLSNDLVAIAVGPDNNLWATLGGGNKVVRVTYTGTQTEFTPPTPGSFPGEIVAGPDGNMWYMSGSFFKLGKVNVQTGAITEYPISGGADGITAGPDGLVWYTISTPAKIGKITTSGVATEYTIPFAGSSPGRIVTGPDGALYFTDAGTNKIGRILTNGTTTQEYTITTASSNPTHITLGPDGSLWFSEYNAHKVGKLTLQPLTGPSPLVSSVLPTSRSVQVGNVASFFATIINSGSSPVTGCRIVPKTYVNGYFSYQTTNPATNALIGTPNTSANIPAGGLQTFVVSYKAATQYAPTDVQFTYSCDGILGASAISGVNTMQLVFDTGPVADMIAVGVTPSNDGFARTGGNSGTGIFAVATTNIGPTTTLTAKPRLSNGSMPLTVTLCETNASAQCKAPPAATVSLSVAQNATPTFSVFLAASGAIAADPAANRVFLEFLDGGSVVRGSTSTAVTTQ